MNSTTLRRRVAGGAIALAAVAAIGGSHGLTAHASAMPSTAICDEFGSCYDDGLSTAFNDPNSSWMSFWDSNNGSQGYYDTNSGDLWSTWAGTSNDTSGGGGAVDNSWSSYSGLYDPGSSTSTVGGGGGSDWSTYSGLYDPGASSSTTGGE